MSVPRNLRLAALTAAFFLLTATESFAPRIAEALPYQGTCTVSEPVTVYCQGLGSTCASAWNAYQHDCYGQAIAGCAAMGSDTVYNWSPTSTCSCSGPNCWVGGSANYTCLICVPFEEL